MSNKLIYITGKGHSGSTILDLLLGNHPQISSGGEFRGLWKPNHQKKCSCGRQILECDYWERIRKAYMAALNIDEEQFFQHPVCYVSSGKLRIIPKLIDLILVTGKSQLFNNLADHFEYFNAYRQFSINVWTLYRVMCQINQNRFIVDSSKGSQRLMLLYMTNSQDMKVIHLVRDGRAVLHSELKRGRDDIKEIAREWKLINNHSLYSLGTIPSKNKIFIRYEDLCIDTTQVMGKLFEFLDIDPIENFLLGGREHHLVPGNALLRNLSSTETKAVKLNELWKSHLSKDTISTFDSVAGKLNRKFGYE